MEVYLLISRLPLFIPSCSASSISDYKRKAKCSFSIYVVILRAEINMTTVGLYDVILIKKHQILFLKFSLMLLCDNNFIQYVST